MKELDTLWELYQPLKKKTIKEDYNDFVDYMRRVEHFAIGVKDNFYSKKVVKKQASFFFANQYNRFMKEIITQRRKQFKRNDYYKNIEDLVKDFSEKKHEEN